MFGRPSHRGLVPLSRLRNRDLFIFVCVTFFLIYKYFYYLFIYVYNLSFDKIYRQRRLIILNFRNFINLYSKILKILLIYSSNFYFIIIDYIFLRVIWRKLQPPLDSSFHAKSFTCIKSSTSHIFHYLGKCFTLVIFFPTSPSNNPY